MTNDEIKLSIIGFLLGVLIMLGFTINEKNKWEEDCIKHECAQYNGITGKFEFRGQIMDEIND
jgi:hypothetical protein